MSIPKNRTPLWNVPYQRNPFFTGREEVLNQLHQELREENAVALSHPQGISGLGGIGKTQTAIEYAYRYHSDYNAVFWLRADSSGTLTLDFISIAHLLRLPESDEPDQQVIIDAVMQWLRTHTHWLLIFDNVEDYAVAAPFIPLASRGHILLTTRAQATGGIAQRVEVESMRPEVGALLLLRRASMIPLQAFLDSATSSDRSLALEISQMMDGLPLALDQAGAYIKALPCSLSSYFELYRTRRSDLLETRGSANPDYPESVATTWSLSFEKVTQANPMSTEILHFCAFLYPDAIPEEIIAKGEPDPLQLDNAIKELRRFSLIHREPDVQTFTLHRLVQAVIKDKMERDEQREWAEAAVIAVNATFPSSLEIASWPFWQRYLPQARECMTHIEYWDMASLEASVLLNNAGQYLKEHAQYMEAERFTQRALAINEQLLGTESSATAITLSNLAALYVEQGKYVEAEPLMLRALAIAEQVQVSEHPNTATHFNSLAVGIDPRTGTVVANTNIAMYFNNLARLYVEQGRYAEAELLHQRTLAISEQQLGAEHPVTASALNNLALLYDTQGKYTEAELLYKRALAIREQVLGAEHPDTASSLIGLAECYRVQSRYAEAEPLYKRALAIREQVFGAEHPDIATGLHNLAALYEDQSKHIEAEALYKRALAIREQVLGAEHADLANTLDNLAVLYGRQGRYPEAVPLMQRALAIREQVLGAEHPNMAISLNNLGKLYEKQGRYPEAEPLYRRALTIAEQGLGPEHPNTVVFLENLGSFYDAQEKYMEAEPLYLRALAFYTRTLGPDHSEVFGMLSNLMMLSIKQWNFKEAKKYRSMLRKILYRRMWRKMKQGAKSLIPRFFLK